MKPRYLSIIVAIFIAVWIAHAADTQPSVVSKPSSGRWQICPVASGVTTEGKPGNRSENTILIDTETGKTWLFWPTRDTPAGYSWIELTQRKDAPKAPKAE
jgi:hypothetical protein